MESYVGLFHMSCRRSESGLVASVRENSMSLAQETKETSAIVVLHSVRATVESTRVHRQHHWGDASDEDSQVGTKVRLDVGEERLEPKFHLPEFVGATREFAVANHRVEETVVCIYEDHLLKVSGEGRLARNLQQKSSIGSSLHENIPIVLCVRCT